MKHHVLSWPWYTRPPHHPLSFHIFYVVSIQKTFIHDHVPSNKSESKSTHEKKKLLEREKENDDIGGIRDKLPHNSMRVLRAINCNLNSSNTYTGDGILDMLAVFARKDLVLRMQCTEKWQCRTIISTPCTFLTCQLEENEVPRSLLQHEAIWCILFRFLIAENFWQIISNGMNFDISQTWTFLNSSLSSLSSSSPMVNELFLNRYVCFSILFHWCTFQFILNKINSICESFAQERRKNFSIE